MRNAKLTKSIVESLAPGAGTEIAWDAVVPGFGARVTPAGCRIYYLKYRTKAGGDPSLERTNSRMGETIADPCERYHQDHSVAHKKPSSVVEKNGL